MTSLLNAVTWNAVVAVILSILVAATSRLRVLERRPGLRHLLWLLVMVELVTPPLVPFRLPSFLPELLWPASIPVANAIAEERHLPEPAAPRAPHAAASQALLREQWRAVLVGVIAAGSVLLLSVALIRMSQLRRALGHGASDRRVARIAEDCAHRMGARCVPVVCIVSAHVSPLLWVRGGNPVIVIPQQLAGVLTDEQLACIVGHELAHFIRRDHWTNAFAFVVAALCWWNPVVWWARRELRAAQELCCDSVVICGSPAMRRRYAETLLRSLEYIQSQRPLLPELANGFGGKSSVKRRFEMIADQRLNHRLSWWGYALLMFAAATVPCRPAPAQSPSTDDNPDAERARYVIASEGVAQTDARSYRTVVTENGWAILAFDRASKRLLWSAELPLSSPALLQSGTRILLHAADDATTAIASDGQGRIVVQEMDAAGSVIAQCVMLRDTLATGAWRRDAQFKRWPLTIDPFERVGAPAESVDLESATELLPNGLDAVVRAVPLSRFASPWSNREGRGEARDATATTTAATVKTMRIEQRAGKTILFIETDGARHEFTIGAGNSIDRIRDDVVPLQDFDATQAPVESERTPPPQ